MRSRDEIVSELQVLGFSEIEAKVYTALLVLGSAKASDLIKSTGVSKPKAYQVLEKLAREGYVEVRPERPMTYSLVRPSVAIKQSIKRKAEEMERIVEDLASVADKVYEGYTDWAEDDSIHLLHGKRSYLAELEELLGSARKEVSMIIGFLLNEEKQILKEILPRLRSRGVKVRIIAGERSTIQGNVVAEGISDLVQDSEMRKVTIMTPDTGPVPLLFVRVTVIDGQTQIAAVPRMESGKIINITGIWTRNRYIVDLFTYFVRQLTRSQSNGATLIFQNRKWHEK